MNKIWTECKRISKKDEKYKKTWKKVKNRLKKDDLSEKEGKKRKNISKKWKFFKNKTYTEWEKVVIL